MALQGVWVLVVSITSTRVQKAIMKKMGTQGKKKRANKKKAKGEPVEVLFLWIVIGESP